MTTNSTPRAGNPLLCLVANTATASIHIGEGGRAGLRVVESHANPDARAKGHELLDDAPGRSFESAGSGRNTMDQLRGLRDEIAAEFARTLCDRLAELGRTHGIKRVLLVAAPGILGHLRSAAEPRLKAVEIESIDKDLTAFSGDELRRRLPELI
jgi:protein required for attachment to host cells